MTPESTDVRLPMTSASAVEMFAFSFKVSGVYSCRHTADPGSSLRMHSVCMRVTKGTSLWHCSSCWNVTLYHSHPLWTRWPMVQCCGADVGVGLNRMLLLALMNTRHPDVLTRSSWSEQRPKLKESRQHNALPLLSCQLGVFMCLLSLI